MTRRKTTDPRLDDEAVPTFVHTFAYTAAMVERVAGFDWNAKFRHAKEIKHYQAQVVRPQD
jgi:hypothetical protein